MKSSIEKKVQEWLDGDFDSDTKNEIRKLIENGNETELEDRFYQELEFGTAGLRGIIGAGTNRMNVYNIARVSQGLAAYLKTKFDNASEMGVIIGYDCRRMSKEFAITAAEVFAGNNIEVYIYDELRPTPLVAFGVKHLKTCCGIVITASHNPPEYNGYKVYWNNGAQIIPPHDKGITGEIDKIEYIKGVHKMEFEEGLQSGIIKYIGEEIDEAYMQAIETLKINSDIIKQNGSDIKIAYTPLHGTGYKFVDMALKRWGFNNLHTVAEQKEPDGEFPTVDYPNPEAIEGLELVLNLARKKDVFLVIATDPDSDRLAVAANDGHGNFKIFNGHQIGSILTYYILSEKKKKSALPEKALVTTTVVSTAMVKAITDYFNVYLEETLTGFKWICNMSIEREKNGYKTQFGFEEALGYTAGTIVRDKDGISSACLFAEIAAYCKHNNMTIVDYLDSIYKKVGFYLEKNINIVQKGVEGAKKINAIMSLLRDKSPVKINNIKITKIRDIKTGLIKDIFTNTETSIDLPSSNVLTFYFKDGSIITARPSGTEPKIKFYIVVKQDYNPDLNIKIQKENLEKRLETLSKIFIDYIENLI